MDNEWIDSIYVGCYGSISPPAFISYQSNRTNKKKIISNNLQTDIITSSTRKVTVSKIKQLKLDRSNLHIKKKEYSTIKETSFFDPRRKEVNFFSCTVSPTQTRSRLSNSTCCILTIGCIIFFILLIPICITIGTIIFLKIKIA